MNWPLVKLSDVVEVNPRPPKGINSSQQVSFIGMASASNEGFLLNEEMRVLSDTKKGFTYFEKSDVLLAKITPCFENGKCLRANQISKPIGFGSTEFHVLRVNPVKVDSTYLFYIVWGDRFRSFGEASMSGAAGQKRVSAEFLKEFRFPLPPLVEQKRIAAILDKADAIRRKRQQAIQLSEKFLNALFLDMFGDLVTKEGYEESCKYKIRDLVDYIDYRGKTPKKTVSGIPLITAKNVKKGYIDNDPNEYIPEENYEAWMTRGIPLENDVLFTTEAPLGNVALLGKYDKVVVGQRLIALRSKGKVTHEFLVSLLLNPFIQGLISNRSSGSTVKGIRTKELYEIKLPIPEKHLQEKFSEIYWQVKGFEKKNIESMCSSKDTFRALSQRFFSS